MIHANDSVILIGGSPLRLSAELQPIARERASRMVMGGLRAHCPLPSPRFRESNRSPGTSVFRLGLRIRLDQALKPPQAQALFNAVLARAEVPL